MRARRNYISSDLKMSNVKTPYSVQVERSGRGCNICARHPLHVLAIISCNSMKSFSPRPPLLVSVNMNRVGPDTCTIAVIETYKPEYNHAVRKQCTHVNITTYESDIITKRSYFNSDSMLKCIDTVPFDVFISRNQL